MALVIIGKYSEYLKPVFITLQSTQINVLEVAKHIKRINQILRSHRGDTEKITAEVSQRVTQILEELDFHIVE